MTVWADREWLTVIGLGVALAACGGREAAQVPEPVDVLVSVRQGAIEAPDSIKPGWKRIRVSEDGEGHIVVLFRLPPASSAADIAAFLAALDTADATPPPGVAMGGPEIGDVGDVVVHFVPGRYVFGCVIRGPDRHRHANAGESKAVIVAGEVDSTRAIPPTASLTLPMIDFAYAGAEKWAAGPHMIRVANNGKQDHQLRLIRLKAGSSINDWMKADDPRTIGTPVAGVARMSPGEVAYLPIALSPGSYVALCLVTDPKTRKAHVELGMLRSITVE